MTQDPAADVDRESADLTSGARLAGAVSARAVPAPSSDEPGPVEAGPRRRLLVVLASVAGVVLLWMLFRSVPAEGPADPQKQPGARAEAVDGMANQADPSWMQTGDTVQHPGESSGSVVPPVFGAPGNGSPAVSPTDSAGNPSATAPGADSPAASAQAPENPRREAFLTALRSKPLQGSASSPSVSSGSAADTLQSAPSYAQMEAAAEEEAGRRSAVAGPASSSGAAGTEESAGSGSRSSYSNGGSLPAPNVAGAYRMVPRSVAGDPANAVVPVGTVIEGQLHTAVNSDLPGSVIGIITQNVYDAGQRVVVIPRSSWLFGTYESDVATGQARLVVQWTSLRLPDGTTFDMPALRAADRTGASGLAGRVNNHYGRVFGQAVLSSVFAAAFQSGTSASASPSRREALADATAQQLGQATSEVTRRNLAIKPTITVPRMTRFSILLDRDLVFPRAAAR
jgi:type IV secretory pathway VirB10-like protein